MNIIKKPLGLYKTNCYILEKEKKALIIDPGFHGNQIIELLGDIKPLAILLTHAHCDHICAVDTLYENYHLPIYLNSKDDELLHVRRRMPSIYRGLFTAPYSNFIAKHYEIGPFNFDVYETPGHSAGSVCIAFPDELALFTGDTLFKGTVGDTDTYNGNKEDMEKTIAFLKTLNPNYVVYPGHSENTILKEEWRSNKYFL